MLYIVFKLYNYKWSCIKRLTLHCDHDYTSDSLIAFCDCPRKKIIVWRLEFFSFVFFRTPVHGKRTGQHYGFNRRKERTRFTYIPAYVYLKSPVVGVVISDSAGVTQVA